MEAKITKFSLQRTQNFNLGDFHGVKIGMFNVTVEMVNEENALIQQDEKPGFSIDLEPGETFQSLVVRVQGMMSEAIQETAKGFQAYVVPFKKKSKNGMMVEIKETFQGSEIEEG